MPYLSNRVRCAAMLLGILSLAGCNLTQQGTSVAEWSASELFYASSSQNLILTAGGISLEDELLIEDDGPANGYSSKTGAAEVLQQGIIIRKDLMIDEIPADSATIALLVYPDNPPTPNNGRHLVFSVNGHDIIYEVNHFWTSVPVPAAYLVVGLNSITVRPLEADTRFRTYIALDENYSVGSSTRLTHPNRSAKSTDGGKTWNYDQLGESDVVDGEYPLRLKLHGYKPDGWLITPVIDTGIGTDYNGIKQPVLIDQASISLNSNMSQTGLIVTSIRSGSTSYPAAGWSGWQIIEGGIINGELLSGRYIQAKLEFKTSTSHASPTLNGLAVNAAVENSGDSWITGLTDVTVENHPVTIGSYDFDYENPLDPALREIRQSNNLDAVVAGSETDFEMMERLRHWVSGQWNWRLYKPDEQYLRWDARDILAAAEGGEVVGGYCLQYSTVLMQTLQSFGIPARVINANYSIWGGHELTEAWSNDLEKWVLLDANFDTHFIDPMSGTPLDALELHERFLAEYYPGEVINRDDWSRASMVKRAAKVGKPNTVDAVVGGGANSGTLSDYMWWLPTEDLTAYCGGYGFLNMAMIRYLPRSNFLSQPYPVPVNHGRTHWGWTGYYCWYDEQTPRSQEHAIFTNRRIDLYPNLNQVDFTATIGGPGVLIIAMHTNSPNFDHFVIVHNDATEVTNSSNQSILLESGQNLITMRVVDTMGNYGAVSTLALTYNPDKSSVTQ